MSEALTIEAPAAPVSAETSVPAPNKHKRLTLCMIVKNEAHVIERCLASVLPVIDYWVIVDTGSTDGTQQKIQDFFDRNGIDGEMHNRPWIDFGHNRSEALELLSLIHI